MLETSSSDFRCSPWCLFRPALFAVAVVCPWVQGLAHLPVILRVRVDGGLCHLLHTAERQLCAGAFQHGLGSQEACVQGAGGEVHSRQTSQQ